MRHGDENIKTSGNLKEIRGNLNSHRLKDTYERAEEFLDLVSAFLITKEGGTIIEKPGPHHNDKSSIRT